MNAPDCFSVFPAGPYIVFSTGGQSGDRQNRNLSDQADTDQAEQIIDMMGLDTIGLISSKRSPGHLISGGLGLVIMSTLFSFILALIPRSC